MERPRDGTRSSSDAASHDCEPTAVRPSPGARRHAVLGLLALVLAYLGLALGIPTATSLGPSGLTAAETGAQRSHLVQRDRGQTVVTVRGIDPPRADRPSTGHGVADLAGVFPKRGAVLGRAAVAEAGRVAAPVAFRPRAPPVDVAETPAA
jgi:hypothetical protein